MFKYIILAIALAITFGALNYENEKIVIDTGKSKNIVDKSKKFIDEHVEFK
jgi:hypothetical protein